MKDAISSSFTRESRHQSRISIEGKTLSGIHCAMAMTLTDRLTRSVLAVPPLARSKDLTLNEAENTKLIRHIEAGGIRTLLYGGNANFYHIAPSEFEQVIGY